MLSIGGWGSGRFSEMAADPQLRAELEKKSDDELIAQLASLKPLHNSTDYDTRKRLIRALEIAIYEAEHPVERSCYLPKNTYYIGTLVSRDVRNAKIDKRLDARLEEGMVEEIKGLIPDGNQLAVHDFQLCCLQNMINCLRLSRVNKSASIDNNHITANDIRLNLISGFLHTVHHPFAVHLILGTAKGNKSNICHIC